MDMKVQTNFLGKIRRGRTRNKVFIEVGFKNLLISLKAKL
jgi:hypothetical protein